MSAQIFTDWLVEQSVQVALVFVLVLALDALFARLGHVRLRAAVWAAFFVKLALPPSVASPVSVARLVDTPADLSAVILAPAAGTFAPGWIPVALFAVWSAGFVVSASVAARRMSRARARWSGAGAIPAPPATRVLMQVLAQRVGLRRAPPLLVSAALDSGVCIGVIAPRIVVPIGLLAPERRAALEHVLLHELGHARRRDGLRSLAWTAARCVYWFHPLVHAAARRAALVREMSCDELAAWACRDGPRGYRTTLLEQARSLVAPAPTVTAFAFGRGQIVARLERLSRPPRPPSRVSGSAARALFVLVCVCCVPLGRDTTSTTSAPAFDDLQGCLRKRYVVMAEMARQSPASLYSHRP